jgi:hypothetical protein
MVPWPSGKRVRMPNLKLVLFTLWAAEGEPMPRMLVIHRTGLSPSQTDHALAALVKLGAVRRLPSRADGSTPHPRYELITAKLKQLAEPDPPLPVGHRLTLHDAARIRDLVARGEPKPAVAARFCVSRETIRRICRGASHTRPVTRRRSAA